MASRICGRKRLVSNTIKRSSRAVNRPGRSKQQRKGKVCRLNRKGRKVSNRYSKKKTISITNLAKEENIRWTRPLCGYTQTKKSSIPRSRRYEARRETIYQYHSYKNNKEIYPSDISKKAERIRKIKLYGSCFNDSFSGIGAEAKHSFCHLREEQQLLVKQNWLGVYVRAYEWDDTRNHMSTSFFPGSHWVGMPIFELYYYFHDFFANISESSYNVATATYTNESDETDRFVYEDVPLIEEPVEHRYFYTQEFDTLKTEIPSRLDAPLIPLPHNAIDYYKTGDIPILEYYHPNHKKAMITLKTAYENLPRVQKRESPNITTDINDLKYFYNLKYSRRGKYLHNSCYTAARQMSQYDLSLMMDDVTPVCNASIYEDESVGFLLLIQRMRSMMLMAKSVGSHSEYEAELELTENKIYIMKCNNPIYSYRIMLYGEHFCIEHSGTKHVFFGPSTYLDYLYTISDVSNNVNIIKSTVEYPKFKIILELMMKASIDLRPHNEVVTFFKNYEAFCLYLADLKAGDIANWDPVIDTIRNMVTSSNNCSNHKITLHEAVNVLIHPYNKYKFDSLYHQTYQAIREMTPLELLEASSLHKFIFFAEVDVLKGLNKFVKRTHSKVPVERDNLIMLIGLTKKEFTINYHKKNHSSPNMSGPGNKPEIITNLLHSGNYSDLNEYPLTWWYDVKYEKTLNMLDGGHPVEYAKDKGAITEMNNFGPMNNKRELIQVMTEENYSAPDFLNKIREDEQPKSFIKTNIQATSSNIPFPVRLCEKEKEQKVEARLFGVGTAKFKHKMSEYMYKAKHILSFFDDSYMTMSDKLRKSDLHGMAQLLNEPDTLAIMIDITGHNQSMQPDNTYELLEFMGNLYGEEGWGKLSKLFNNLVVYHYNHYMDEVHISKGQHGGIEGWMNPVWTLVTLQQVKLLRYTTPLSIIKIAGYSDDVSFVIRTLDHTPRNIKVILDIVSKEMFRLGFVVKPQQSAVSKKRITMLRQHYVNGQRADSTLKRLLAVSSANSGRVTSEEIEINAISSSITSALEGSYHIKTCVMLKWYKACLVSFRTLSMLFEDRRINSMLSVKILPPKISSVLYNIDGQNINVSQDSKDAVVRGLNIEISRLNKIPNNLGEKKFFESWITGLMGTTLEQIKSLNITDTMLYLAAYEVFVRDFWFSILALPQILGGLGVELLINQMISGHSDAVYKSIYYVHRIIGLRFEDKEFFYRLLSNSLNHHVLSPKEEADLHREAGDLEDVDYNQTQDEKEASRKITEKRSINNKWLLNSKIRSANSVLQSALMARMKTLTVNKRMLDMMKVYDIKDDLAINLVEIFRKNFSHRVVQFYYENSLLSMAQYLLRKLETSTSLLNGYKNKEKLKQSLSIRSRNNLLEMLSTTGVNFGIIRGETDILSYLISRRKNILPTINFIDIEEPLYDHSLVRTENAVSLVSVYHSTSKEYRNGVYGYKAGFFTSETLYKGEIAEEDTLLQAREEFLIAKIVSVTKWSILRSYENMTPEDNTQIYDFHAAADLVLSTLCQLNYQDLEIYTPLNIGGEILHRIPNQKFSTKVATRCLPNSVQAIKVTLSQTVITNLDLEDSNINFEYMRLRLATKYAMRYHYQNILPIYEGFNMITLENVHLVKDFKPQPVANKIYTIPIRLPKSTQREVNFNKVSIASSAYLYSDDILQTVLNPNGIDSESVISQIKNRNERIIFNYYLSLRKEMLIIDFGLCGMNQFKPLFNKLRLVSANFTGLTDREIYTQCIQIISKELHDRQFSTYKQDIKSKFYTRTRYLRETSCELSEEYLALVGYIKTNKKIVSELVDRNEGNRRIEELSAHFINLSHDVFLDLSLGYCLVIKDRLGEYRIDAYATYANMLSVVQDGQYNLNIPEVLRYTIFYIGTARLSEILVNNKENFIHILELIDYNCHQSPTFKEDIKVKYKASYIAESEIEIPIEIREVMYRSFEISPSHFNQWSLMSKTLKAMRKISELYTNQVAFYSPTGSDSLVGQYGFFKALLDYSEIKKETPIYNMAAGRGDGRLAARYNGLTSYDYSKPTMFSKIMVVEGVNTDLEFDLTKFETLPEFSQSSLIHIDLSHIKGKMEGLQDTIMNLVSLGHMVSLRANSLDEFTEVFGKFIQDNNCKIQFWHATSKDMLPYQCYITFKIHDTPVKYVTSKIEDLSEYKLMMTTWLNSINYDKLYSQNDLDLKNSITVLLPDEFDLDELLTAINDLNDADIVTKSIKQLIRLGIIDDLCMIDSTTAEFVTSNMDDTFFDLLPANHINGYGNFKDEEIGRKKQKGFPHWKRAIEKSNSGERECWVFNISQQPISVIRGLSHSYPIARYRSFFKNIADLYDSGLDLRSVNYEEYVTILSEHASKVESGLGDISTDLREVMSFVIVSAMKYGFKWGINMLLPTKKDSRNVKLSANRKVSMFKKMAPIYHKLRMMIVETPNVLAKLEKLENSKISEVHKRRTNVSSADNEEYTAEDIEKFKNLFSSTAEQFSEKIIDGNVDIMPTMENVLEESLEDRLGPKFSDGEGAMMDDTTELNVQAVFREGTVTTLFDNIGASSGAIDSILQQVTQFDIGGEYGEGEWGIDDGYEYDPDVDNEQEQTGEEWW